MKSLKLHFNWIWSHSRKTDQQYYHGHAKVFKTSSMNGKRKQKNVHGSFLLGNQSIFTILFYITIERKKRLRMTILQATERNRNVDESLHSNMYVSHTTF